MEKRLPTEIKIVDVGSYLAWQSSQPRHLTHVVNNRAMLRVLPLALLKTSDAPVAAADWRRWWLSVFRAAFLSWASDRYGYPTFDKHARSALRSATAETVRTNFHLFSNAPEAAASLGIATAVSDIWSSISEDAAWLADYGNDTHGFPLASLLASERLWLGDVRRNEKYRVNLPPWIRERWDLFKKNETAISAGFSIWCHWYDSRLMGERTGSFNRKLKDRAAAEGLDHRIARQPDDFWERVPAEVNREINTWISRANEPTLYNLIMTAAPGTWDGSSAKVLRSRFLEHTEKQIAKQFESLDANARTRLISLPTLFAYEAGVEAPARVGKLRDIHVTSETLDIWFDFDQAFPAISPKQMAKILSRLGISNIEQYRTHWAIKQVDLYSVLLDLDFSDVSESAETDTLVEPPEPPVGPGPQYVLVKGKLSEQPSPPDLDDVGQQSNLHRSLQIAATGLRNSIQRVANRYPELANAAEQYSILLDTDTAALDIVGIWSVGGSLAAFAKSYREQNVARTLAEPLEPEVDAILQNVVRQHGAFILGFQEGRDLVHRADEFAVDPARLSEMAEPGTQLLSELTENRALVDERTRALHRPIRDSINQFGWTSSRLGFSGYVVVRNGFRAIVKLSLGNDPNLTNLLGLVVIGSTIGGDPSLEFARAAISSIQFHGPQLLAFFNHSPEMRAYIEWALKVLEDDHRRNQQQS